MPIKAAEPILAATITAALSMGPGAMQPSVAAMIMGGVASAAAMGQQPVPPPVSFIPVIPAGVGAAIQLFTAGMSGPPDVSPTAAILATSVALVAPQVPPAGLATLQQQLEVSMRKGEGAEQSIIATEWAAAIINYYVAGSIV